MFDSRRGTRPATAAARGAWGVSLGAFLEVVACSIGLVGLMEGSGWWFALVGVSALLLAVPALLRAAGLAAWLAAVLDLLLFAALLQLVFTPAQSWLDLVPTRATLAEFAGLFQRAGLAIENQHVPAQPLPELIFFIVLFGGALAILLDVLAVVVRAPALTAVVVGGVLVVPAILQPGGLGLTALGAGAAAWFVLLAADRRLRRGPQGGGAVALAVGASVTLLALVVAGTAPGFVEQGRAPTAGPVSIGDSIDPLIDLGADLRRPDPVKVLRYTTSASTPQYLQLTTLDTIRGTAWTHSPGHISPLRRGAELAPAPGYDAALGISARPVTATIDVQDLLSGWLPAPYPTTRIDGSPAAFSYQDDDLTLFAAGDTLSGEHYTTTSLQLTPTSAQLAAQGPLDPAQLAGVQRDLALPGRVPQIIIDTAHGIAADALGPSEFDVALAIQSYFQNSLNDFTYSTDSPDTVDGASLAVIAKFLTVRQGYCVHFASAMAVISRVLGIPSRIAIGYLPGAPVSHSGKKTTYQVESSDLHAWPQLYFPGAGWLNFEPTVSRGAAPAYTLTTTPDTGATSAPQSGAQPSSAPVPSASQKALPGDRAAGEANAVASRNGVQLELGILIALAALASPAAARLLRRRGRLTRLRDEGGPPQLAWDEIRDTAQDLGFAASPTETPRAFAERLRSDWHPDAAHGGDLDEILELVEATEFGPARPWARYFELAGKTASVTAGMRAARPWPRRVLARLAPRSLATAFGPRRAAGRGATYDRRL
jgi:transglutaminase-like putative cysteine protease